MKTQPCQSLPPLLSHKPTAPPPAANIAYNAANRTEDGKRAYASSCGDCGNNVQLDHLC